MPGKPSLAPIRARLYRLIELSHALPGDRVSTRAIILHVTDLLATRRPLPLAIVLIVTGMIGLGAAFALTLDKFRTLEDPGAALGCNFSLLVQCGKNLASPQGAVFGFPNPLMGLVGFFAPVLVGTALLAGAHFARWFWIVFNVGVLFALGFVIWLIGQSIFVLGTLCPWCMVVWVVTIPLFLVVTLNNVASGVLPTPPGVRRFLTAALNWTPLISIVCYLVIAVLAQLRLDVVSYL